MQPATPADGLPMTPPIAPAEGSVLEYAVPAGGRTGVTDWVHTFGVAIYWWLASVGAAKMFEGLAGWVAMMLVGGPNPRPALLASQPAFIAGLVVCAIVGGVAARSWRLGAILFVGAVAVAVADLAAPEPDPWAAGMPVAAAFAVALVSARLLWPTRFGRGVAWAALIVGLGIGLLFLLGVVAFALIGWRAK